MVDVYSRLVELCGLSVPENQLDGKSLVPVLNAPALKGKDHIFIKKGNGFTLKTPRYSYTEYINLSSNKMISNMLYDQKVDVDENVNVVNMKEYNQVVSKLRETLHSEYHSDIVGN